MPHLSNWIYFLWTLCASLLAIETVAQSAVIPLSNPSACELGITITPNGCANSQVFEIQVNNAPGTALGTDVYLSEIRFLIGHIWLVDLELRLTSPSGKQVLLLDEVGGSFMPDFGDTDIPDCASVTTLTAHTNDINCGFEAIDEATWPYTGAYLPLGNFSTFNDGASPNGTWRLEVCDDHIAHTGKLEFVELVFATALCLKPSQVQLLSVDSNSAEIEWVAGAFDCSATVIEAVPAGALPGTGAPGSVTTVVSTCPQATVPNLLPSTVYDVYLRQDCGSGNFSAWSCPLQVETPCSPAPITLVEDFNSQSLCEPFCGFSCEINGLWQNSLIDHPGFDWIVHEGPTSSSNTGPDDDFPGGGKYIYIDYSSGVCEKGKYGHLVSKCIDAKSRPGGCDMTFDYAMFGSTVQSLLFQVSEDGGQNWDTLWEESGNQGMGWNRAYIDLASVDGKTVQFRFQGEGGNNSRGDIALDNLTFFGSTPSMQPLFTFYADEDEDGYGNPNVFYQSCEPLIFPGYLPNGTDCDDELSFVNPGAPDSPCDGFDTNCNPDDDFDLPPPVVFSDTICSGETPELLAQGSTFGGTINWYAQEDDTTAIGTGFNFSPPGLPPNLTTAHITYSFFAEEVFPFDENCQSVGRSEAFITILPQAEISTTDAPSICAGASFDLTTIDVIDAAGANGIISYHNGFPASAANEIDPMVFPSENETFYIASTPEGGCTDVVSVDFSILPTPEAQIQGDSFICFNAGDKTLTANNLNLNSTVDSLYWNTQENDPTITISPNSVLGETDVYTLTLIGDNGCENTDTLVVETKVSIASVSTSSTAVTSCGGADGTLTVTPQGGQPPYIISWSGNGQMDGQSGVMTGHTFTGLTQGAYSLTITDASAEGCVRRVPIVTINGPGVVVDDDETNIAPVSCNGGSDGCIEIDVIGSSPSILWETGDTTEVVCGLSAGTYGVTISNAGCLLPLSFTVPEPDKLIASPSITDVTCHGMNDGEISLNVFNGNGGYQYQWQHGPQTSVISNLFAGSYSVTVTDSKGCISEIPFAIVHEPSPMNFEIDLLNPPSCFGGSDGHITVRALGGTAPYDVDWSNNGMGTTINNLASGTYGISIDDANGCFFESTIELPDPPSIEVVLDSIKYPTCDGIDNGSIYISATGGSGPLTFLWSNGSTGEDQIDNLPTGTFKVTVTDGNGCTRNSEPFLLSVDPLFTLTVRDTNPDCVGVDNGAIFAEVAAGGTGPFNFFWSTDESVQYINGLPPDDYQLIVIDLATQCRVDTIITLSAPQIMNTTWTVTDPACFSSASGQIEMTVLGGVQPHKFLWSNQQCNEQFDQIDAISGLVSGNYAATVTDANGCELNSPLIPLKEPSPLVVDVVNVENITCAEDEDGSIDLLVHGGTGEISILWTNDDTTASVAGLAAGVYSVTATDEMGCVNDSISVEITSPAILDLATIEPASGCLSFTTDSLCLEVSGGILPYEYNWSNGDTVSCLYNAPVGDYSITLTDANGCEETMSAIKIVEEVEAMALTLLPESNDTICHGDADGSLLVAVDGGLSPYQYIWDNGELGTDEGLVFEIDGLNGGEYQLTITDDQGCTQTTEELTVVEWEAVIINAPGAAQTPVNCHDGSDGALNISAFGGLPPYSYAWADENGLISNDTIEDLTMLPAGNYSVTVTDEDGCLGTKTVNISQPAAPLGFSPPVPEVVDERCFGDENGEINLNVVGGTAPYLFFWNTEDTTTAPKIFDLVQDEYFVTVHDANGCEYFSNAIVVSGPSAPLLLDDFAAQNIDCFDDTTGMVDITMSGGFGDYVFEWIPSDPSNSLNSWNIIEGDLVNVAADNYSLRVFDEHLCLYDTFFILDEPAELVLTSTGYAPVNGSGGTIISSAMGGTPPYSFALTEGGAGDTITGLPIGFYEVTVTDAEFCQTNLFVEVPGVSAAQENEWGGEHLLFPNPTTGQVWLNLRSNEIVNLDFQVFDAFGKNVFTKKLPPAREISLPFDLSSLPPGVYFGAAYSDGRRLFTSRIIVVGGLQP